MNEKVRAYYEALSSDEALQAEFAQAMGAVMAEGLEVGDKFGDRCLVVGGRGTWWASGIRRGGS